MCTFLVTACGGDTLSSMKGFEPNVSPVITSFTNDIPGGTELVPGLQFNLSVEAYDVEGELLEYSFSSDSATFRNLVETDTGCTTECYIRPDCSGTETIVLTVKATDETGGESTLSMDVGDGRAAPALAATWPADRSLGIGETQSVTISADCSGFYQVSTLSYFDGVNVDTYTYSSPGADVTATVGRGSSTLDLTVSSDVYIIFRDRFGRVATSSVFFTVE